MAKVRATRAFTTDSRLHHRIVDDMFGLLAEPVSDFESVKFEYLRGSLLSKYVELSESDSSDRRRRAISKWFGIDARNAKTNDRLRASQANFTFGSSEDVIFLARKYIAECIGYSPDLDELYGSFSNGASTSQKRHPMCISRKFSHQADVTPHAKEFLGYLLGKHKGWMAYNESGVLHARPVEGNVMFTVPKSSDIDRVCCKEPDLNMFAQKAVGDFFRSRLRSRGIDLNDQSVNRSLARKGSTDGKLATLDLSSASDSISITLVNRLLPNSWGLLLDVIRSRRTYVDGEWYESAMYSSMGNGFTFELESLIFWALARSIQTLLKVRGTISVYGDDIVLPTSIARSVMRTFSYFGFQVNMSKSMFTGRLRESCGGHYWNGRDVTPFYIKEPINNVNRLIHFLNRFRKWAAGDSDLIADDRCEAIWRKYAGLVDKRLWGGRNLSNPSALVAPGRNTLVLVPKVKKRLVRAEEEIGMYLHELRTIDSRKGLHLPFLFGVDAKSLDAYFGISSSVGGLTPENLPNLSLRVNKTYATEVEGEFCYRRAPKRFGVTFIPNFWTEGKTTD